MQNSCENKSASPKVNEAINSAHLKELADLRAAVTELRSVINSQNITVQSQIEKYKILTAQNATLLEEINYLKSIISNFYLSRSWRCTRPFRTIATMVRVVLNKK